MKYEIEIFHYIDIYKREWKKMLYLIVIAMFITMVFSYIQPTIYKSTAIVLSPKEGGQVGNLGRYLGLPSLAIGGSSDEVIFSMLKSRRMSNDVDNYLTSKYKRKFWWSLDTYTITGGFAIEVKGSDPELTKDTANFTAQNLDKINSELQISTQKPMIKVLDQALRGAPVGRNIPKKAISSGLFVFLAYALFIFFKEYFSHLKNMNKRKEV